MTFYCEKSGKRTVLLDFSSSYEFDEFCVKNKVNTNTPATMIHLKNVGGKLPRTGKWYEIDDSVWSTITLTVVTDSAVIGIEADLDGAELPTKLHK